MDGIVWQPLSEWAEKFRYEFAASSEPMRSLGMLAVLGAVGPTVLKTFRALSRPVLRTIHRALASTPPFEAAHHPALQRAWRLIRLGLTAAVLFTIAIGVLDGTVALIRTLMQPWPAAVRQIPLATGASVLRLIAAYAISLAWTIPCAIAASESQRFARRLAPIAEIVGSMPATALFPLIVIFVIRVTGGMNLASILLILTGMQWYVLFNLLAGISQIPADLKEAARSFVYRGTTYKVFGLGAMLDDATYQTGNGLMILLTLLSMVLVVLVLNRLVWRRLYDVAADRYRIDY